MPVRNKSLDILRAIAVFMTFGRHMVAPDEKSLPAAVYKVLRIWFKTGWAGVALFFVLSGFLVSSLMFNEFLNTGDVRFGRFYLRRGLKIYPAFYFLFACSLGLWYADTHWLFADLIERPVVNVKIVLSELFFLQNYLGSLWGHVWSLAVEEHFYILLGLLIYGVMELYPRLKHGLRLLDRFTLIPWICSFVFLACLGLRFHYVYVKHPSMDERFWGTCYTHLRIDALFFGVLLAYFVKFRPETFLVWVKRHTAGLLIAGLILTAPSLRWEETDNEMLFPGFTSMYLGFGCLLMFALYHPWKPRGGAIGFVTDMLAAIGQNSYSIYLWHFPVMYVIGKFMVAANMNYYVIIATQNVAGLVVGLVMAKLIEMPVLVMRDKYYKATRGVTAGVVGEEAGTRG